MLYILFEVISVIEKKAFRVLEERAERVCSPAGCGALFFRSLFHSLQQEPSPVSLHHYSVRRILNRTHYLRAIIISKTNSYFLLWNRKLINQSSRRVPPFGSFKRVSVYRFEWTQFSMELRNWVALVAAFWSLNIFNFHTYILLTSIFHLFHFSIFQGNQILKF